MGISNYTFELAGYDFWFRSAENLAKFQADPWKYAPRCGGFCAYAVACHGGHGVCAQNGPVAVNATEGWAIYQGKLYLFNHGAKELMFRNLTSFDLAEHNWKLWYPDNQNFNTDAFWPYVDPSGESTCQSCGFEPGSSAANKLARNRKFFLARSGAVNPLSQHPHPHIPKHPKNQTIVSFNISDYNLLRGKN
eukprot:c6251_g1_i2.p1 GENE.c6251_g1_i2~~c6251_g1_i2.p1  ORF type:complete len:192 (+),score=25.68 c6251_g1_i2:264-839(+)